MTTSTLRSASVLLFTAAVSAVLVCSTGCEWESSGDGGTWSDSMSWVNFSGLYRSGSGSRHLVSNFSLSSGGTGDSTTTDDTVGVSEYRVPTQNGPVKPAMQTVYEDVITFSNVGLIGWRLKPGSITVTLNGTGAGAVGEFTDNGAGVLSGTYNLVPVGPSYIGTGTIDYDTGAWTLTLQGDAPFLEEAQIRYSYVYQNDPTVSDGGSGGATDDGEDPPTSGDWVYTLQVAQTGNRLSFTDNRGFVWEGTLSSVTTPSGDRTGETPGDVVGTFEAKGRTDSRYKITGTFSGIYQISSAESGETSYGQLTSRRIQGIWIEPTGNGDLYGETTAGAQTAIAADPTATATN